MHRSLRGRALAAVELVLRANGVHWKELNRDEFTQSVEVQLSSNGYVDPGKRRSNHLVNLIST